MKVFENGLPEAFLIIPRIDGHHLMPYKVKRGELRPFHDPDDPAHII